MSKSKNSVVLNTTCFTEHKKRNLQCNNKNCRLWINSANDLNCCAIATTSDIKTLQEVGEIFSVTRMRICQIEKSIMEKLFNSKNFMN